jgi:hypothetical protein
MSGLNSIQIQALVREMDASTRRHKGMKRSNQVKYREKIVEENKYLYEVFPTIFEMHYEGKLDDTFFEMLKLRRSIEKGEMTDDQASRVVGQKLFDKYVKPNLPETPVQPGVQRNLTYDEYYKQFEQCQSDSHTTTTTPDQ